jgi:hypothetical protein
MYWIPYFKIENRILQFRKKNFEKEKKRKRNGD